MSKLYKFSEPIESKPLRLVASVVLGFIIMTFINGFIGGMGGIPAFTAFTAVFYHLRVFVSAGERVIFRPGTTDRQIVGRMMLLYGAGYLLLWALLCLALTFSRMTGWGGIGGDNLLSYIKGIFSMPMLEKWAYLFAGVIMFAFVISIFPLVTIRKQHQWIAYALIDGALFALFCVLVGAISKNAEGESRLRRESCLIDCLLVGGEYEIWQVCLYLACAILLLLAVGCVVFFVALHFYRQQKNLTEAEVSLWGHGIRAFRSIPYRQRLRHAALLLGSVSAVGVVLAIVLMTPKDNAQMYDKVAEYLTADSLLGPIEYRGRVYIPVDEELELYLSGSPKGYLAEKGERCDSRLYELTVANVLYLDPTGEISHLQVYGARTGSFAPAQELENSSLWRGDHAFVLWDEEWEAESAYSHELTGYTACDPSFVEALERRFGKVVYRPEDFDNYDAYFTLRGYPEYDDPSAGESVQGHWIGCILVRDNRFYYGSYENEITGALLTQLLDVLGGY